MEYNCEISLSGRKLSINEPAYFIADVASNHDGDLERAKDLIWLAKDAGADAVKFHHFLADKIVSDYGFRNLGQQVGHQAGWKKSVYEVYKECECHRDWNQILAETAKEAQIDFLTTPYDIEAVEGIDSYVHAYKSMKFASVYIIQDNIKLKEVGIRDGEKLDECMITKTDAKHTYEYDKHYIIYPHDYWWNKNSKRVITGKPVPDGFEYDSGKNTEWLSVEDKKISGFILKN